MFGRLGTRFARARAHWRRAVFEGVYEGETFPHTDKLQRLKRLFGQRPLFPWESMMNRRAAVAAFCLMGTIPVGLMYWAQSRTLRADHFHSDSNRTLGMVDEVHARGHARYQFVVPPAPSAVDEEIITDGVAFEADNPLVMEFVDGHYGGQHLGHLDFLYSMVCSRTTIHEALKENPKFDPQAIRLVHFSHTGVPELQSGMMGHRVYAFCSELYPPRAQRLYEMDHMLPWARKSVVMRFPDDWDTATIRRYLLVSNFQSGLVEQWFNSQGQKLTRAAAKKALASAPGLEVLLERPVAEDVERTFLQQTMLVAALDYMSPAAATSSSKEERQYRKDFDAMLGEIPSDDLKDCEEVGQLMTQVTLSVLKQPSEQPEAANAALHQFLDSFADELRVRKAKSKAEREAAEAAMLAERIDVV